jgi:hypothetical protein
VGVSAGELVIVEGRSEAIRLPAVDR